ncbi:MAG: hypothetical protein K2Q18_08375, partial [Bdellovibrionales bacterium]|nr:hypothetical protein [Bdellovibrionales bacterium]
TLKAQVASLEKMIDSTKELTGKSVVAAAGTSNIQALGTSSNITNSVAPKKLVDDRNVSTLVCPDNYMLYNGPNPQASRINESQATCVPRPTQASSKTDSPGNVSFKPTNPSSGGGATACPAGYVLSSRMNSDGSYGNDFWCDPLITEVADGQFQCAFSDQIPVKNASGKWTCQSGSNQAAQSAATTSTNPTVCEWVSQPAVSCAQYAGPFGSNADEKSGSASWSKNSCTGNIRYDGGCSQ